MARRLPPGWTLERLRTQVAGATLLEPRSHKVKLAAGDGQRLRLEAEIILAFHGQCLVRIADEDGWYMGGIAADGTIICWDAYGSDLGTAIDGL